MNDQNANSDDSNQDEMSDYLQVFLDETEEELDSLVDALLQLETQPEETAALNEAFRLMHSLKGSAGMMGYLGLSELAHQLENRFEAYRSGTARLDRGTMDVILSSVDFMRSFSSALRNGDPISDNASDLISQLHAVEQETSSPTETNSDAGGEEPPVESALSSAQSHGFRVRVTFEKGLQLADLKARLIVARLSNIGEIIESEPAVDDLQSFADISQFVVVVSTHSDPEEVRRIAEVDGVESVEIESESGESTEKTTLESARAEPNLQEGTDSTLPHSTEATTQPEDELGKTMIFDASDLEDPDHAANDSSFEFTEELRPIQSEDSVNQKTPERDSEPVQDVSSKTTVPENNPSSGELQKTAVSETVRVETNRLDRLMNLTGELIVTKARFTQISDRLISRSRTSDSANRIRDTSEHIRQKVASLKHHVPADSAAATSYRSVIEQLERELSFLDEQSLKWKEERSQYKEVAEAVDQLTRVSNQLQQGVLDTRMVPVGPLFNRFKRVIRDLSLEFGKQVRLEIKGEKTELDKRMIDELGDPLLHLVRNSLDHGLESGEVRLNSGKPELGTITLEASHSGNNVLITVGDDGAGLNVERIKARVLERKLAIARELEQMTDAQICEFIWSPGFSTAEAVTDISGRGVGMDIVKKRISDLKGTVDVETTLGRGTRFRIRLPLTLAIIHSLLVRYREGLFSIPIDDVREIVSVKPAEIFHVHKHQTIDVRGVFIPLLSMSTLFEWNHELSPKETQTREAGESRHSSVNVVILQWGQQTFGLRVDELLGGEDTVVKSLSDNFIPIRGLSGASIMGDGSVCLMLDTSAIIELARERTKGVAEMTRALGGETN